VGRHQRIWVTLATVATLLFAVSASQAAMFRSSTKVTRAEVAKAASSYPTPGSGGALFGCTAGVAPISIGKTVTPLVDIGQVNKAVTPCIDASTTLGATNLAGGALSLGTVGPAAAYTFVAGQAGSTTAPAAAAVANVQALNFVSGANTITIVGPVQGDAAYECENNKLVQYGQSTLDVIYVNGVAHYLPKPGAPATIAIGALLQIDVNQTIKTATSITEDVLTIHVLGAGVNVIVGQAEATIQKGYTAADVCDNTAPTKGGGGSGGGGGGIGSLPGVCPKGSTYDAALEYCVIRVKVVCGTNTPATAATPPGDVCISIVKVSRPFSGPTGGTVYTIWEARLHWKSPCLYGSRGEPDYVLVVTKLDGHATGTFGSDRILLIGGYEYVQGLSGNDCIDAHGTNAHVTDGNGDDFAYVHVGTNHVKIGDGKNGVYGGNGRDFITVGNGYNWIVGGSKSNVIYAGLGPDHIFGGPSPNQIHTPGGFNYVNCGSAKHGNVLWARKGFPTEYGASHGCETVHYITHIPTIENTQEP
jgi:hypothetical protein